MLDPVTPIRPGRTHELRVPDRPREGSAVEGRPPGQAPALRAAQRRGRARDALHRPVHRAAVRRRDREPVRDHRQRLPRRRHHPDALAQRDARDVLRPRGHGAAVLPGRRGSEALRTAEHRRLRLRAGRLRACVQDRGSRPPDGYAVRRLRAVLPAHGHRDRPPDQGPAAVHPRLPAVGGGRRAAQHAVPAGLRMARRLISDHVISDAPPVSAPALPLPPPAHELPLPPAHAGADGIRLYLGVPSAATRGVRPLELDVYLPADGAGPVPVVVFLHGGGWQVGSRHSAGPGYRGARPGPFEAIAQAGIAVASLDYRLSGEAIWPAQLHDAKAAVRWLRARSAELGIDPERVAAWGESAGGHLAELLGLSGEDAALEGDVGITGTSSRVSAVVAWYAPSDVGAVATDT